MNKIGTKIAQKRKDLGMTQAEFAAKMCVTRQTISRWENGSVMPDIDKIGDIATLLNVTCDYLLKDDATEKGASDKVAGSESHQTPPPKMLSRLLQSLQGQKVKLEFFDEEGVLELYNNPCIIREFEGNWMKITVETRKGTSEHLLPISSICAIEIMKEDK